MSAISKVLNKVMIPSFFNIELRGLTTTSSREKNLRSGVPKSTRFRTKKLTYEQARTPHDIYRTKNHLSWNTANLHGEERKRESQTAFEDMLIRKFMYGTWHKGLVSEVIIKRKHNIINLAFIVSNKDFLPRQLYFLQGYTEELLTHWLKCRVKVQLSTVQSSNDMVFKMI